MGVCIEERNKNKKIINEEVPLPGQLSTRFLQVK